MENEPVKQPSIVKQKLKEQVLPKQNKEKKGCEGCPFETDQDSIAPRKCPSCSGLMCQICFEPQNEECSHCIKRLKNEV